MSSKNSLHKTFEVVIIAKAVNGALEIIGGVFLLFLSKETLNHAAMVLTQDELSRNPKDFFASHILHSAQALTGSGILFGAIYLLIHGLVKVVLVAAIFKGKLWAYPWMIGFLLLFIVYQLYQITLQPSLGLSALTIFDGVVALLTYREYQAVQGHSARLGSKLT